MHRTAVDYAYAELQAAMLSGRLLPGTPISESEWAKRLEMSVTPIREALRRLEADGLVVRRHHRDVRVRPFSLAEAHAVYQLRGVLEPMAAALALESVGAPELKELRALVGEQREALGDGGEQRLELLNNHFHMAIARFSKNPLLEDELRRLWHMVPIIRAVSWRHHAARRQETVAEHAAILAALEGGDREEVVRRSQRHVLSAWARVEESLRARLPEPEAAAPSGLGTEELTPTLLGPLEGTPPGSLFPAQGEKGAAGG